MELGGSAVIFNALKIPALSTLKACIIWSRIGGDQLAIASERIRADSGGARAENTTVCELLGSVFGVRSWN